MSPPTTPSITAPPPACPICGSGTAQYAVRNNWPIFRCSSCRHGFVFPRPTHADVTAANAAETAAGGFAKPDLAAALARRDITSTLRLVQRAHAIPGRMLDVGAGDGAFSMGLSSLGYQPHMIDLDPRGHLTAAAMPNASFAQETFESLSDRGPYALILMSQVLEHALDPMDWLARSRTLLAPGGVLVIALPNFGGIYRLLGSRDPYLIPPVHVNFFTPRSLRLALAQKGFTPLRIDSDSQMNARRGDGRIGLKRAILSGAMKLAAPLLDPFAKGIILRAVAR